MAADAEVEDARFQALFGRVASDPAWIERVSWEITDAIQRELAEIEVDDELRAGTFASTRSVLTLMADMVRLGHPPAQVTPPPDAVEYLRQYVRHPLAPLGRRGAGQQQHQEPQETGAFHDRAGRSRSNGCAH